MADLKPRRAIRRFDVFAEFSRLKALEKENLPPDEAKGYGIWLAKVVAARKFRKDSAKEGKDKEGKDEKDREQLVDGKWRTLSDEPQTDALFDKEIIDRMGDDFYNRVFSPAIQKAYKSGKDYMDVRDEIRKDWKPGK